MKKESVVAIVVLCLVALVALKLASNQPSARASNPEPAAPTAKGSVSPTAWQVPVDVPTKTPTQTDWLNFGWQTFVALDWPALSPNSQGVMGQPDTNSTIGATAANGALVPAVWSTFRDVSTIMLANGTDPGATYNQPVTVASSCPALGSSNPVAPGFQPEYIDNSTFSTQSKLNAALAKSYVNQASTGPLVAQNGWYTLEQILVAPSEYAYIQGNGYYLGANQVAAFNGSSKSLAPFPNNGQGMGLPSYAQYGALEIKAAWRVLDPSTDKNVIPRYYKQWGYFMQADGKTCQGPTLFGLIGLHILRLTPSTEATWFWASFEQVDNTMPPSNIPATLAAANTPNGNCTGQYNVTPAAINLGVNIPWNSSNKANNICQVTPIPQNVQTVNQSWQSQLQGTVWQYYQMVNTLNPCSAAPCYNFPPIPPTPSSPTINVSTFANTSIESYFQYANTTCMSCHGYAAGDGAPSTMTANNQIFTFVLQNAYWPGAPAAANEKLLRLFRNPPKSKLVVTPKAKAEGKYKN